VLKFKKETFYNCKYSNFFF